MTEPSVRFASSFTDDLTDAVEYYEAIGTDLANRFRGAVETTLRTVQQRPESFGKVDGAFRCATVEPFPYFLLFSSQPGLVRITRIVHAASDPKTWITLPES